jgi:hypothetical protein
MQTMLTVLTVLTQNSGFRRSAGWIGREGRQKGLAAQIECELTRVASSCRYRR